MSGERRTDEHLYSGRHGERNARGGPGRPPDALYAEAESVLSQSANELRGDHGTAAKPTPSPPATSPSLGAEPPSAAAPASVAVASSCAAGAHHPGHRGRLALPRARQRRRLVEPFDAAHTSGMPSRTATAQAVARHVLEAQEAERARLAEELHDGPAQALANAVFQVRDRRAQLATDPAGGEDGAAPDALRGCSTASSSGCESSSTSCGPARRRRPAWRTRSPTCAERAAPRSRHPHRGGATSPPRQRALDRTGCARSSARRPGGAAQRRQARRGRGASLVTRLEPQDVVRN